MTISIQKSDLQGAIASTLCLIHCLATPFIFITQAGTSGLFETMPLWWKSLDYLFLIISFIAVLQSTKHTSSQWIKPAFWTSWSCLTFLIANEKLELFELNEYLIFIPTIALISLHLINQKYCKCQDEKCCM